MTTKWWRISKRLYPERDWRRVKKKSVNKDAQVQDFL